MQQLPWLCLGNHSSFAPKQVYWILDISVSRAQPRFLERVKRTVSHTCFRLTWVVTPLYRPAESSFSHFVLSIVTPVSGSWKNYLGIDQSQEVWCLWNKHRLKNQSALQRRWKLLPDFLPHRPSYLAMLLRLDPKNVTMLGERHSECTSSLARCPWFQLTQARQRLRSSVRSPGLRVVCGDQGHVASQYSTFILSALLPACLREMTERVLNDYLPFRRWDSHQDCVFLMEDTFCPALVSPPLPCWLCKFSTRWGQGPVP